MQADSTLLLPLSNGLRLALDSWQQMGCAKIIKKEIFQKQIYRRSGFEIGPNDTVVDVGANTGLFTLWAATQARRVIAIEPTAAIHCLQKSLALNQIQNVSVVQSAVSDRGATIDLLVYPGFNAITHAVHFQSARWGRRLVRFLLPREQEEPVRITAPAQTLAEILRTQNVARVDFLKVDCEGGEYALFESVSDETLRRIQRIALEFHELHPSHDYRRLTSRLEQAGYQVEVERTLFDRCVAQTGMIWAKRL